MIQYGFILRLWDATMIYQWWNAKWQTAKGWKKQYRIYRQNEVVLSEKKCTKYLYDFCFASYAHVMRLWIVYNKNIHITISEENRLFSP